MYTHSVYLIASVYEQTAEGFVLQQRASSFSSAQPQPQIHMGLEMLCNSYDEQS